jgi:hypothetical protein
MLMQMKVHANYRANYAYNAKFKFEFHIFCSMSMWYITKLIITPNIKTCFSLNA